MINRELLKSILLGSLVFTSLAFGSFKANATDLNQNAANDDKVISAIKFQNILDQKSSNQLSATLVNRIKL